MADPNDVIPCVTSNEPNGRQVGHEPGIDWNRATYLVSCKRTACVPVILTSPRPSAQGAEETLSRFMAGPYNHWYHDHHVRWGRREICGGTVIES